MTDFVLRASFLQRKEEIKDSPVWLKNKGQWYFMNLPTGLLKTLGEMILFFGPEREACVSRELTKIFEENIRGSLMFLSDHYKSHTPKGEIVIVVAGKKT